MLTSEIESEISHATSAEEETRSALSAAHADAASKVAALRAELAAAEADLAERASALAQSEETISRVRREFSKPLTRLQYEREHHSAASSKCALDKEAVASAGGEGIHICVYIASFRRTFDRLSRLGLTWTNPRFAHLDTCDSYAEAHASRQFRFRHVVDLDTGEPLLELEHEVRAQRHAHFFKRTHYPEGSGL